MAILPVPLARVSAQLRSKTALSSIAKTQADLVEVQNELTTGVRVNLPGDDPGAAAVIQQLQKTLEQRAGFATNLQKANSQLGEVDSSLGDITDLLQQAQTLASANVGSDVSAAERQGAATQVQSLYKQLLGIANKQFNGVYLFAGDKSTEPPFVETGGTLRFVGSDQVLQNRFDESSMLPFMVNGADVFGALGSKVTGATNLSPALSATTRIVDLSGAGASGVHLGTIRISDGTTTADVELSGADTVGDIVNHINAAGLAGATASIGNNGLVLSGSGNITVNEVGGGTTAADLGILMPTGGGAGVTINGASLGARVTPLTPIAGLRGGAGLDPAGITISNDGATAALSFAGATSVEDVLNIINAAKVGVRASINAAGTGIDIASITQGGAMTISENGGATATQLGVRSMTPATALASLNGGAGIGTTSGPDMQITRRDGTTFSVDLDNLQTVQDVINAIDAADAGGGVTASFGANGNGIVLTDTTGGGGTLAVTPLGGATAAKDLGLTNPASGNTITGSDVNPISATGVFANLAKLTAALRNNDQGGITAAAGALKADYDRIVVIRGQTGAQVKALQARQTRLDDENVATKSLLSDLRDTDFTTAVTKMQQLQTQLQASYQTTARLMNLSLLDFLG
jgi:flagellar hook-associated protein 3 FlgL